MLVAGAIGDFYRSYYAGAAHHQLAINYNERRHLTCH